MRTKNILLLAWVFVEIYLSLQHVVWRDEVRALSIALQGDSIYTMLMHLRGEGHPALWFLLLRMTHSFINRPEVLQIVSLSVAFASVLLLIRRSPFSLILIGIILFSKFTVYEYSVMARNYGISMLLLFLLAAYYERYRDRGVILGLILFLLANCNAHSIMLVGAFLIFWFLDSIYRDRADKAAFIKVYFANSAIAVLGIVCCIVTIYPTYNDAAQMGKHDGIGHLLYKSVLLHSSFYLLMSDFFPFHNILEKLELWKQPYISIAKLFMTFMMFGSTLGLIKRPAAAISAGLALIGFSLFFNIIYGGGYRHQCLWLVYLISLYWITFQDGQTKQTLHTKYNNLVNVISKLGYVFFVLLLLIQVNSFLSSIANLQPESRSKDLGILISTSPNLQDAILIGEPDSFLESLPYYISNKMYLMRERRFGNFCIFTKNAKLSLSLEDILKDAKDLHTESKKPIVILLKHQLRLSDPAKTILEGYNWEYTSTPEQVQEFLAATKLLKSFGPVSGDESYDVYLLD